MPSEFSARSASSSKSASPTSALVVLPSVDDDLSESTQPAWRTILSDSHQVVLYNSDSHALSVRPHDSKETSEPLGSCPYCNRPLNGAAGSPPFQEADGQRTFASNYFHLLEVANEASSQPSSRGGSRLGSVGESEAGNARIGSEDGVGFRADTMAEGYFHAFFKEEYRLGMGANGSVYLCQVLCHCSVLTFVVTFVFIARP